MAVNIQDSANELGNAIQNSEEYQILKKLYNEVNVDPQAKDLFGKFRTMQVEMQQKQMMGQEIGQEEIAQAQIIVADVQKNEKIAKLMEAEEKMNNIIMQVNQIVLKPIEELYGSIA